MLEILMDFFLYGEQDKNDILRLLIKNILFLEKINNLKLF